MGKLIVNNAITVNGAFEAPAPDHWLVMDDDWGYASHERFILANAMVLGRKTYEGLAAVCPSARRRPGPRRLRRAAERHAEVRRLTDAERASGMERHADRGDLDEAPSPR